MSRVAIILTAVLALDDSAPAADRISILDYGQPGAKVDRTGVLDVSKALAAAIGAANMFTSKGESACVYIPPGIYRISLPPPPFERAGCVLGEGPSQSVINIDAKFAGDLFAWSEAWVPTTPGPMIVGLKVRGNRSATNLQNAFVFYDRNDQVFMDNVDVVDLHGRALYSGVSKKSPQAYLRESHMRSLRFFQDGAPGVPVVEFNSQGTGQTDATNEIRMSQVDIYGAHGPSFVIRNNGDGGVRAIHIDQLRIEGSEDGSTAGDLLTIGDPVMHGLVAGITMTDLELVDPSKGYAALRVTAARGAAAPYQIYVQGSIGGGVPKGRGLVIDAGRNSQFHLVDIYTLDTNVTVGKGVSWIELDGGGRESAWTYAIDPASAEAILVPEFRTGNPRMSEARR